MTRLLLTLSIVVSCIAFAKAQQAPTSSATVTADLKAKTTMLEHSMVKNLEFKNIGPTIMSGRVVDIAVNPKNPTEFYVAYASGGLWHTQNNGTSFTPIFDNTLTQNLGDIAVHWDSGTIWAGTGENNSSRSSYAGIGLLKSTDNGATWENMGLADSHHFGRILINPDNPDEVVVGVIGHLYSDNEERGIYKTTDGGASWSKNLFISDATGVIDLVAAPQDFNIMYASAWERDRKAWNFNGSGSESGIYKSTDGGDTWSLITTSNSGFPTGDGVGRIGLAAFDATTIYAVHDSQFRREEKGEATKKEGLSKDTFRDMSASDFLKLDNKALNTFLKENGFQEKYRAENVKQMIRSGNAKPIDLVKYLEDANALLFDTPVVGAELYRSEDGGKTWQKMNQEYIEGLFYSYGYYFAMIAVDPNDKEKVYLGGVPIIKSADGGKTWESINGDNVHADHHSLWVNPNLPGHLINGNDGGINISYDDGATWIKNNAPAVGQFYAIAVDDEKPYNVYGGLQDNGVWVAPHTAKVNTSWQGDGDYPWQGLMGGDGMQVEVDSRDANVVYTGFQFGNYFRLNRKTGEQTYIQPKHELGETPYRFNWQTPILLSPHNQDILYLGGNKLMRSMNKGDDWVAISPDLTNGGKKGNVAYGTLTSISESPFQFGLLYAGSDDGKLYVSKNSGGDWEDLSASFPKDLWVSRVVASRHKKSRVYVTLNGYRWDDFTPYVYVSDDFGKTWRSLSANLPVSPVNVLVEDSKNESILYLGTDDAAYISLDMGQSWEIIDGSMPRVAVHDIKVQEREADLILGTHGRSIYVGDIQALQQFDTSSKSTLQLFSIDAQRRSRRWGASWGQWSTAYEPQVDIPFYTPNKAVAEITIQTKGGTVVQNWEYEVSKGFQYVNYDLTVSKEQLKKLTKELEEELKPAQNEKYYLPKGVYEVVVQVGGDTEKTTLEIK